MNAPRATYRLQFNRSFTFKDAFSIIPYLARLGISTIYASPVFMAKKGSMHGYDIIDPSQFNPEIGTEEEFNELSGEAKRCGLTWLQDIVPNHMAYNGDNKLLTDVLEKGTSSQYVNFFDIDWQHPYESIKGKLLAPFLGTFYSEALENGEIRLNYDRSGLTINYYELSFPLRIESYSKIFTSELSSLKKKMGAEHPDFVKLMGVLYALKNLPSSEEGRELYNHINFIKRIFWELYSGNADIRQFIDRDIASLNGRKGDPASFNALDRLLSEQLFRLSFWKVASEELNYRRFFSINELISLKVEHENVFNYVHSLVFRLISRDKISGLRIDHIDGLYDPTRYLRRLRDRLGDRYIVVEKILQLGEELPAFWPVQGTTGYDFLNHVNGLFCQRENEDLFTRIYSRFIGFSLNYHNLILDKKRLIIGKYMAGDVDSLAHLMKNISNRDRYGNDITMYGLKRALVDVLALFPVYRTYINKEFYSQTDRTVIQNVMQAAKEINPGFLNELNFIEKFLLLDFKDYFKQEEKNQWIDFVMRFQQYTGPLMAKGFEDTALYVYNRLISLNEVGGNPGVFGISAEDFHCFNERREKEWPHAMSATSTHDTKRGEDARARINVLSEMPDEWRRTVRAWARINHAAKKSIDGEVIPSRNDEYLLYQTLVGSFPLKIDEYPAFIERIKEYIIKAVREAKIYTAWLKPDEMYENAFADFIAHILRQGDDNLFLKEFLPFQKKVSDFGLINSLAQTLLKITCPGVPDFYQGTELWNFSLVDPDNRRPVDFNERERFLKELEGRGAQDIPNLIKELMSSREDGRIKLFLIQRALASRKEKPDLFAQGAYLPLTVEGRLKGNIVAFARKLGNSWALTVIPRFITHILKQGEYTFTAEVCADTHILLPAGCPFLWKNSITDRTVNLSPGFTVGDVLRDFPVALLINV